MKLLQRLAEKFLAKAGFLSSSRQMRYEVDTLQLLVLAEHRRRRMKGALGGEIGGNIGAVSEGSGAAHQSARFGNIDDLMDSLYVRVNRRQERLTFKEWASRERYDTHKTVLQQRLHEQVVRIFSDIRAAQNSQSCSEENKDLQASREPDAVSQTSDGSDGEVTLDPALYRAKRDNDGNRLKAAESADRDLRERCGFSLRSAPSGVSPTVDGVYVQGGPVLAGGMLFSRGCVSARSGPCG